MKNKTPIPQPRSPSKSSTTFKNIVSEKEHGFTLIELIVVIIIVGILAAVGISQYSTIVEKSRIAEAKIRLGTMRQLAYDYYLNNGSLTGLTNADVGTDYTCNSSSYYRYEIYGVGSTWVYLGADRCTADGKSPNATTRYYFYLNFNIGTGESSWHCWYVSDHSACFGLPT